MKLNPAAIAAAAVAVLMIVVLATVGAPSSRPAPTPLASSSPTPPAVSANGFTLSSAEIALPEDTGQYPAGPHADAVNANCAACHSPSMVLTQPRLSADQWKAEVTKMREVYKAPVPDEANPDIVAYLTSLPTQQDRTPPAAVKPATGGRPLAWPRSASYRRASKRSGDVSGYSVGE